MYKNVLYGYYNLLICTRGDGELDRREDTEGYGHWGTKVGKKGQVGKL